MSENMLQSVETVIQDVVAPEVREWKIRLDGVDKRLDGMDRRFDGLDKRFDPFTSR